MKNKIFASSAILILMVSCSTRNAIKPISDSTEVMKIEASAENMAKGKVMYENNCGKCHELFNPSKYNDEKWPKLVEWMAPKAKLNAEQKALISTYLLNSN